MIAETRDIPISYDHPRALLSTIRHVMQQILDERQTWAGMARMPEDYRVVIVDAVAERGRYLGQMALLAGYKPVVVARAVDAFSLYLRDAYAPLAILISQDDAADHLFLARLSQRAAQQYGWTVPLLHLRVEQVTAPLPPVLTPRPPAPSLTGWSPTSPVAPSPLSVGTRSPIAPNSGLTSQKRSGKFTTVRLVPRPDQPVLLQPSRPSQPLRLVQALQPSSVVPAPVTPAPATSLAGIAAEESIFVIQEVEKRSLEGQNLGRYQFTTLLGGSKVGQVYIAYDRLRETEIAVKSIQRNALPCGFVNDDYLDTNLFQQELDLLANIKHPHIRKVLSASKSYISGTPFYYKTMPYFQEGSLATWRFEYGQNRPFSSTEVLPIAVQLLDALQCAHKQGILYQNFKLTNILLEGEATKDMRRLRVALTDFALTGEDKSVLRTPDTLYYLAPEQWYRESFPASDQYGLAAMLYELLAGRPPFQGNQQYLLKHMHLAMQPQRPSDFHPAVPYTIDEVILRALEKNPQDRFASVAEFGQALRAAV